MKRFSPMITGAATIAGGFIACVGGIIAGASNSTLSTLTAVGAAVGFVGILIYQAVTPLKG